MSLLELTLETVEANLALDEALLIEADEGRAGAVLRFWDFPRFAVVLGASRRLAGDVRVDACQEDGVPIVRRSSGGGTVVIGPGALNVTVILPNSAAPGLSAVNIAHRYVLDRIAGALRAFDRAVAVEGSGDLTVSGRKFGGSASAGSGTGFLSTARFCMRSRWSGLAATWPCHRDSPRIGQAEGTRTS